MRILIATYARGPLGGVETILRTVVPALAARGHTLALLHERGLDTPGAGPDPYAACDAIWNLEETGPVRAWEGAAAWAPDLVWVNSMASARNEARAAALAPSVLYAHGLNSLCAAGTRLQWQPQAHVCMRAPGLGCLVQNYVHGCGLRNPVFLHRLYRGQRLRRQTLPRYRRIVACSRYLADALIANGAAPERVSWLHFAPAGRPVNMPEARWAPPRELLCLARLVPSKGVEFLLRALREAQTALGRRLRLVHGGLGPESARLRELAAELRLEVNWRDWIAAADRSRALADADLLVVPSLVPEPFGIVGREAQMAGVPAVAFSHGGIPEWLTAGVNGELAPGHRPTVAGLAAALVRALEGRAHLERLRLGAWASAHAFALPRYLDELEEQFLAVLAPHGAPLRARQAEWVAVDTA